ncbi:MAG: type II toxin-antitoxin system RelE family toxin [Deltaproteobacteria bacterium]
MAKKKAKVAPAPKKRQADLAAARLESLDRDRLSVFLYLAIPPPEAVALLERLNVSLTGYRPEALGDIEKSDLLADEYLTYPEHRKLILKAVEKELGELPAAEETLGRGAIVLGPLFAEEGGTARAIARLLVDSDLSVRETALDVLTALADYYLGEPLEPSPEEEALPGGEARPPGAPPPDPTEGLRRELERARERADGAERERTASREQLQAARRELAETHATVGELRRALGLAEAERDRLRATLEEARSGPHSAAELRLRREVLELKERIERLEEERRALRANEARLELRLSKAHLEGPEPARAAPAAEAENDQPEEAPASWLMPVFTREYYDSLEGWDRRLQRAAFHKAMMLAQDHRHPSLRALPLEGLPNLYRIRVATDVRLLYRRGEKNVIEILRLIDREDLDKWIKIEKSRA